MKLMKAILITGIFLITFLIVGVFSSEQEERIDVAYDACTDIIVGKDASVDGSVITSHTGCCPECRVHVVPAQAFKKGAMAPVYYGLQDVRKPLHEYGKIIGTIPQVEKTYAYFHTGYPSKTERWKAITSWTDSFLSGLAEKGYKEMSSRY